MHSAATSLCSWLNGNCAGNSSKDLCWEGTQDDAFVEVRQEDFLTAASTLQPSLSQHEIARYAALRDTYRKK